MQVEMIRRLYTGGTSMKSSSSSSRPFVSNGVVACQNHVEAVEAPHVSDAVRTVIDVGAQLHTILGAGPPHTGLFLLSLLLVVVVVAVVVCVPRARGSPMTWFCFPRRVLLPKNKHK